MMNFQYIEDLGIEYMITSFELNETIFILHEDNAEKSSSNEEKAQEIEKRYERLIVKEFPKHLKYAFLGAERVQLVIIAADLIEEK